MSAVGVCFLMPVNLHIDNCAEGSIIAADIYNDHGVKLVCSNTTINKYIIKKLKNQGIEEIRVYEPVSSAQKDKKLIKIENSYKESVVLVKEIIHELLLNKKLDYGKVFKVSESIYSYSDDINTGFILKCLREVKAADEYTYYHSVNVGFYSMIIAKWIGLPKKNIKQAVQSGFLHDIGKAKVPVSILNKPARLTEDEFNIVKKHPIYGYFILSEDNFIDKDVKHAVLLHHERIGRNGYPFVVSEKNIGLLTSIVSVADVYDAMTSDRVYKKKATPFAAFEMFLTEGTSFFDSYVTNVFVNHMAVHLTGSEVMLSNGSKGKIVYVPPQNILSPVIYADGNFIDLHKSKLKIIDML